jgi:hypothetical protein
VATFGKTTQGGGTLAIPGDLYQGSPTGSSNKQVSKFTLSEPGTVTSITADLQRASGATLAEYMRLVVYADSAGSPGAKKIQSNERRMNHTSDPAGYPLTRQWITFTLPASVDLLAGDYWIGVIASESSGQVEIGYEGSGGSRKVQNDTYSDGASDPFGSPAASDADIYAVYATYTPYATVTKTLVPAYGILSYVTKALAAAYTITGYAQVTKALAAAYAINAYIVKQLVPSYRVKSHVTKLLSTPITPTTLRNDL